MNKTEGDKPSRIKEVWKRVQDVGDRRLVKKLDKIIREAQPNPPTEQFPKLRRQMIDTSKMPEFVRKRRHKKLERYEERQGQTPAKK